MKALVTGANGFLGRHVVDALLARGIEVRAMVRPAAQSRPARLARVGGGLPGRPADLARSCRAPSRGSTLSSTWPPWSPAGRTRSSPAPWSAPSGCWRPWPRGPADGWCCAAASRSTTGARFAATLDEDSPLHRRRTSTTATATPLPSGGRSGSPAVCAKEHGWDLTVLRPGFIWGRGHDYLAALGQQFGRHHLVIGPMTRMPMTHVENCADVFAIAATDPRARGQTFNIVDGPGERIWRYLSDYMRGTGQRGWRLPVPYCLAISVVRLAYATVFRSATKVPSVLIPRRLESRLKPLHFENRKLRETLGWTPPLDYRQCLERTYGPGQRANVGEAPRLGRRKKPLQSEEPLLEEFIAEVRKTERVDDAQCRPAAPPRLSANRASAPARDRCDW